MRPLLLALVCLGCGRDAAPKPVPQGGSYKDLVTSTQTGPATETRTALACAAGIAVPARPEFAKTPITPEAWEAQHAKLAAMTVDALVRDATPNELVDTVMERLMKIYDDPALSPRERELLLVWLHNGELFNGGHHQFFTNSSGNDALATRSAFASMGLAEVLAIYDCALTAFPDGKPDADRQKRQDQLARWGDKQFTIFERLDEAFYGAAPPQAAMATFIRAHAAELPHAGP